MSVFEHGRFEIWNPTQHPYRHTLSELQYANSAFGGDVVNLQQAMDWIVAFLYPNVRDAVATPGDLPAVGNTVNDMRVVNDDGDGKAASYRWEQREGEASPSWHKIYDVDWGVDSVLASWQLKTDDLYVARYGYDSRDGDGVVIAGDLAGQTVYGGQSAGTHLTLYANAGDGVGAQTGYVQLGDHVRPTATNTWTLGTSGRVFSAVYATSGVHGTLTLTSGSISDTSGAIDFADNDLATTGQVDVGTLTLAAGSITDTSGTINFSDEHLTTTGTVTADHVVATTAASSFATATTVGTLMLANGSITDSSGAISFNDENLSTTGTLSAGFTTLTRLDVDQVRLDAGTVSSTSGVLTLASASTIDVTAALTTVGQTVTGTVAITGQLDADNLRIDGNALSSTSGDLAFTSAGEITFGATARPSADAVTALGKTTERWTTLYLSAGLSDGTSTLAVGEALSLRNNLFRDSARTDPVEDGDLLTFNAASGTWLAAPPASSIAHTSLTGLTTTDAGHTQFVMLAGRAGGQTVQGGTAASETLTLDSTAHATKGKVEVTGDFRAATDASYSGGWQGADLGGSGNRFRHLYTAGEHFGLRLENVGANPAADSQTPGRLVWNTATGRVVVDTGTTVKNVGDKYRFESDTSWNGSDLTKNVTVTTTGMDARKAIWQLLDNTNNYERIFCKITATAADTVVLTTSIALPAGSYRLVGLE